jgi:hypothetical protein
MHHHIQQPTTQFTGNHISLLQSLHLYLTNIFFLRDGCKINKKITFNLLIINYKDQTLKEGLTPL